MPTWLAAISVIVRSLAVGVQDLTCALLRPQREALWQLWGPPAGSVGNSSHRWPPEKSSSPMRRTLILGRANSRAEFFIDPIIVAETPRAPSAFWKGHRRAYSCVARCLSYM